MRRSRLMLTSALLCAVSLGGAFALGIGTAAAQTAGGPNVQRDCQTVRTCNFARNGAVRGCLSSFSCRACKPVAVKCTLPGTCQALRCDWGG
jgi:hypothetical protein